MNAEVFWIAGPWLGKLAIVAKPRGGDWLEDEVKAWRRAGIDVIVSLLEKSEIAELDLASEPGAADVSGIGFVSFPIPDRGVPESISKLLTLVAMITRALDAGKNVGLHCRQGIGRSGLLAAGILTQAGVDPNTAIQTVSSARGLAVPETTEQRSWIGTLPGKPVPAR